MGRSAVSIERHGCLAHTGDGDAGDAARVVQPVGDSPQGHHEGPPQLSRVVVSPAGSRVVGGRGRAGVRHRLPATVEGHDLYVRSTDVGPHEERFGSHGL
ncbi:MAG: hypothetical protein M3N03_05890 [Actinomycetota bacterium]|nr:hypothetical protein [Actinomycetota bacterium]